MEGTITDFSSKTRHAFSVKLQELNYPLSLVYKFGGFNNPNDIYMWQDGKPLPRYEGSLSAIQQRGDGRYGMYKRNLAFSSIKNDFKAGQVYTYSVLLRPLTIYYVVFFILLISFIFLYWGDRLQANDFYLSKIILLYGARGLACVGMVLICVSILGVLLGQDVFYKPQKHDEYIPINAKEFERLIEQKQNELPMEYALRMNELVYTSTIHYFTIENSFASIHQRATPFLYNWVFWVRAAYGVLFEHNAYSVEFERAESALYRGYGYCSQRALMLSDILQRANIKAYALGLNDHVVTRAFINGNEIILDPDYGVAIPHSLKKVYEDFTVLDKVYAKIPNRMSWVHEVYGKYVEIEYPTIATRNVETIYSIIKWIVPVLMLFLWLSIEYIVRRNLKLKNYNNE